MNGLDLADSVLQLLDVLSQPSLLRVMILLQLMIVLCLMQCSCAFSLRVQRLQHGAHNVTSSTSDATDKPTSLCLLQTHLCFSRAQSYCH